MNRLSDCADRAKRCSTWGQKKREECVEERDEGYNACTQTRDQGYRDCCGWIPCKWFCDAWTWVASIVCVAWSWVKNIVCVVVRTIIERFCQVWTFLTIPLCLISSKITGIIDRVVDAAMAVVDAVVGAVLGVIGGVVHVFTHPVDTFNTIVEFFRGCPTLSGNPRAKVFVIAHHGFTKFFPENTAQSCSYALKNGADAVEIDICVTSDGEAILWHDFDPDDTVSLARQVGQPSGMAFYPDVPPVNGVWRRPTRDLTLAEFRENYGYKPGKSKADDLVDEIKYGPRDRVIPTLEEFLASGVMDRARLLCLDIKLPADAADLAPALTDRIHAAIAERRRYHVIVMVPSLAVLSAMKNHSDAHDYGLSFTWDVEYPFGPILNPLLYSAIDHAVSSALHNSTASVGRPVGIFFPWKTYKRTLGYDVKRWNDVNSDPGKYNAGTRIDDLIAWTVDDEDELRCLVRMRVSGIITNEPRRLANLLGRP